MASETKRQGRAWWHYVIAVCVVLTLAGLVYGGMAIHFAVTHVRLSYARVGGLVVAISAKTDARVQEVLVRTGEQVQAGQVVARLDDADLRAEVQQAEANVTVQESALARAEADLELTIRQTAANIDEAEAAVSAAQARLAEAEAELQMQSRQQPDEVRQAEADVASARSEMTRAETNLRRMDQLHQQGATSAQALDQARTDYQVAQAAVAQAEAGVAVAAAGAYQSQMREQGVATRRAERLSASAGLRSVETQERSAALKEQDVLAQRAAVAEAQAALQVARARLSDSELRSTANGVVVHGAGPTVHNGEVVDFGVPVVTIISTDQPLWISGAVSELHVDRVREGQAALIRIDAFGRRRFQGRVEQVGGATSSSTNEANPWMLQQVPLQLSFDLEGMNVKPGMTCRVWIDIR